MKKRFMALMLVSVLILISIGTMAVQAETAEYNLNKKYVRFIGRNELNEVYGTAINWPGAGFEFKFTGTCADVEVNHKTAAAYFTVIIDNGEPTRVELAQGWNVIATGLEESEHTVKLLRSSEGKDGCIYFGKLRADGVPSPTTEPRKKIEFYGDSFTVGYGNLAAAGERKSAANTDNYCAYPSIAARKLGAEASIIAESGRGIAINNSGSLTNPIPIMSKYCDIPASAGEHQLWDHSKFIPQVVSVFLGINDNAGDSESGVENPTELVTTTYKEFITELRGYYPKANIILCSRPSGCYQGAIDNVFAELSETDTKLHRFYFDPCTATGIAGHPTAAEHEVLAEQLVAYINTIDNVWQDEENLDAVSHSTQIAVSGKVPFEYGNKPVTLIMKKKGSDLTDYANWNTNVGYAQQQDIDDEGNYLFKFSFSGNVDEYELLLNQGGKVINETISSNVATEQLVTANMDLVQNGEKAEFTAEILNKYGFSGINYRVLLAAYSDDNSLCSAKLTTMKELGESMSEENEWIDINANVKYVKAYLWNEKMMPLCEDDEVTISF